MNKHHDAQNGSPRSLHLTGQRLDGSDEQMIGAKQQVPRGSKQLYLENAACEAVRRAKEEKEGQTHMALKGVRQALILKRASASRSSGQWNDDDFDVFANGVVVGRMFKSNSSPVGASWMWTLAFEHHEDRTPTHGYAATREAAMAAFAKSWRRK